MMTYATVSSRLQCLNIRTIDTCKTECFASNYGASFSCSFYIFDCSESKLNDLEVRKQYQIEITNRFAASENAS
jgi:hypothetical protein